MLDVRVVGKKNLSTKNVVIIRKHLHECSPPTTSHAVAKLLKQTAKPVQQNRQRSTGFRLCEHDDLYTKVRRDRNLLRFGSDCYYFCLYFFLNRWSNRDVVDFKWGQLYDRSFANRSTLIFKVPYRSAKIANEIPKAGVFSFFSQRMR